MASAISGESRRWPDGVVPYEISPDFSASEARTVSRAVAHWNRTTIMRLRRRSGEDDFVIFAPAESTASRRPSLKTLAVNRAWRGQQRRPAVGAR